jgi:arabinofuranosyltransferase
LSGLPRRTWLPPFVAGALLLVVCWWRLWFLCDDAFIAFRYVGNAYDGHGLVWNPAPWQPVEGYSCFLWVIVLLLAWLGTGLPPPVTANGLALLCALGTLWLLARWLGRAGARPVATWVVVLATAGNATFATWASSGLETAMFGLFAVGWTLAGLACGPRPTAVALRRVAVWAALAMLARPDGALLGLSTLPLAVRVVAAGSAPWWRAALALWPLLVPLAHLGWRCWYYGEWLPNTYYAKVVGAWPESGLRYLYCFACEHGVFAWAGLAVLWLGTAALRGADLLRLFGRAMPAALVTAAWVGYVVYYSLMVGGDHFAWRPFAHLLPLLFASAWWLLRELGGSERLRSGLLAALAALATVPGWWLEVRFERAPTDGFVRVAAELPPAVAPWVASYDRCRAWLRLRFVALPRPMHAHACARLRELLPDRRPGQVAGREPGRRAVYGTVAAGVVAWGLADVDIVDEVGLNDWVVARSDAVAPPIPFATSALTLVFAAFDGDRDGGLDAAEIAALAPVVQLDQTGVLLPPATWASLLLALCDGDRSGGLDRAEFATAVALLRDPRHMAHERVPPAGYVEALRPNVRLRDGRFAVDPAVPELTDQELRAVEADFRARAAGRR